MHGFSCQLGLVNSTLVLLGPNLFWVRFDNYCILKGDIDQLNLLRAKGQV